MEEKRIPAIRRRSIIRLKASQMFFMDFMSGSNKNSVPDFPVRDAAALKAGRRSPIGPFSWVLSGIAHFWNGILQSSTKEKHSLLAEL